MKLKPVHAYDKPRYPELNHENEASVKLLLKRRMPARWKRLAASAAMLCASAGMAEAAPVVKAGVVAVDAKPAKDAPKQKAAITVAPLAPEIAAHGRGGFGCVAVSPPVYLSEDEAKEIIFDELAKAGIHLKPGVKLVRKALNPGPQDPANNTYICDEEAIAYPERQRADVALTIDWVDPEKGVAVELLTVRDAYFWGDAVTYRENPAKAKWRSTAYSIDFGKNAALMSEAVRTFESDRDLTLGIFTTPLMKLPRESYRVKSQIFDSYWKAWRNAQNLGAAKEEALKAAEPQKIEAERKWKAYLTELGKTGEPELRAQVKHFVKWLEEQEKPQ